LEYDQALITKNFGLNSVDDLKIFIKDMIEIFDDFVTEYIALLKI